MLARIGVKVDLLAQTKSKYFGKVLAQNNYDTSFFLLGWTPSTFDSHNPLSALMSCRRRWHGRLQPGRLLQRARHRADRMIQGETDQGKRQDDDRRSLQDPRRRKSATSRCTSSR